MRWSVVLLPFALAACSLPEPGAARSGEVVPLGQVRAAVYIPDGTEANFTIDYAQYSNCITATFDDGTTPIYRSVQSPAGTVVNELDFVVPGDIYDVSVVVTRNADTCPVNGQATGGYEVAWTATGDPDLETVNIVANQTTTLPPSGSNFTSVRLGWQ